MGQAVKKSQPATKLHDHIRELVMRIVVSISTLVIACIGVYFIYEPILSFLRSPLSAPLYYSNPAGSFTLAMKISFMGALIITIPVIIYNLIMFIRPAFTEVISRKLVYSTTILSSLLALAGSAFAFYVILPGALKFFGDFQVNGLNPLISADSYLGFVASIITTFVIVFQLPLLIAFIDRIKPLKPKKLLGFEKWVVLGSIVTVLVTPFNYDVVSSLLIALPIIVLYNLSILLVFLKHSRIVHKKQLADRANIVTAATTINDIQVTDLLINQLSDELAALDIAPLSKPYETRQPIHTTKSTIIKTPDWVIERKLRRETLIEQMRTISETHKSTKTRRVLVS